MGRTVYIDLYFMINFAMDFLCFFLVDGLLSQKSSLLRRALASALGAFYACISLLLSVGGLFGMAIDLLACLPIAAVAYYRRGELRRVLGNAVVFCASSILLGGFMTVLFSFFNRIGLDRILGSEEDADGISVWLFALLALLGGVSALLGGRLLRKRASRRSCGLRVSYRSRVLDLQAMCDSGNLLREPISALPCVIVELDAARELLGKQMARAIEEGSTDRLSCDEARRIRVVPSRSIGGSRLLYALRVDSVELYTEGGAVRVDALVAFATVDIRADGCRAIVPSELCVGI